MMTRTFKVLCGIAFILSGQANFTEAANVPLPKWLSEAIAERQNSGSPDPIEQSTYDGRRVFESIRGDRADTGDEHILFENDGRAICQFGGFVGRVTSGSCDIQKIVYARTLYSRNSEQ